VGIWHLVESRSSNQYATEDPQVSSRNRRGAHPVQVNFTKLPPQL